MRIFNLSTAIGLLALAVLNPSPKAVVLAECHDECETNADCENGGDGTCTACRLGGGYSDILRCRNPYGFLSGGPLAMSSSMENCGDNCDDVSSPCPEDSACSLCLAPEGDPEGTKTCRTANAACGTDCGDDTECPTNGICTVCRPPRINPDGAPRCFPDTAACGTACMENTDCAEDGRCTVCRAPKNNSDGDLKCRPPEDECDGDGSGDCGGGLLGSAGGGPGGHGGGGPGGGGPGGGGPGRRQLIRRTRDGSR
jgi:hypothetical protein